MAPCAETPQDIDANLLTAEARRAPAKSERSPTVIRWKRAGTALLSLLGIALTAPAGAQSAAAKQTPPLGTDGSMPFNDATDTQAAVARQR